MPKTVGIHQLRELYLSFFESKGHARIPSAPLVPENDPSVLFTTAGMHPLVPYLKGEAHPAGKRLTDTQKCLRTTDIDEVGDATHATVFEMLGNWSLGDYFKEDAIRWSWEFLTSKEWLELDPRYLAVSVFAGDTDAPRDEESARLWREVGMPEARIAYLSKEENWWPAGGGQPGPQGPDTEMFYWTGKETPPREFNPEDSRWVEIWNDVFMQFDLTADGEYKPLPQQNVDTGMGLERTVMVLNGYTSIYEIDSFQGLMHLISSKSANHNERHIRIVADHVKAATFLLGDEHPILPSNTDQGYVLRRVIRRAVRSCRVLGVENTAGLLREGVAIMVDQYGDIYPSLAKHQQTIHTELQKEIEKFEVALTRGLRELDKVMAGKLKGDVLAGLDVFRLYESFGFPLELTEELAGEHGLGIDMSGFEAALQAHQEKSRAGAEQKFKGGLADHSTQSVHYHTATHLLHQALRTVLGTHVFQKGSNITPERLRFDFSHPDKMTPEQIKGVEELVNLKISEDMPVVREELTVEEAKAKGALGLFEHKYGEKVNVYTMGNFSCEICGGPHVKRTGELGHFKIIKEESAGAGVRRIKAVLD
ncbi:MAG: alanine--tRNA ligase [Candidatus Andersenbacteria bacterium]